ncbi:MAG: biotin synthase BioB [Lachnospiraceae bacterium]|uniref:Biotin synthase n=1 Tax=Candidatus Weimeria bifida TaxID=2599074 RepID=A0A6N7IXQ1_9FIRM|nr:biotin synthase BioB [Candidatus Weimeria bifida]RRF95453.1 MAG: biotin synthase BioB [Lachnospiraceae bacterium]
MDIEKLADEIIAGKRLKRGDDLSFLITADLDQMRDGADRIRKALCGDKVDLCTIISGRGGRCGENCKFCAQSAHNHTHCDEFEFRDENEIIEEAKSNQEEGVDRFAIVDSGYGPSDADFEKIIHVIERMHKELKIELCCSLGFMTSEQFHRLHMAGVTGIHNNIETSRRFFPHICTTHTFDDKIANIKRAQNEGLAVCSGGIIGMGEDWDDRIDMAITLNELGIRSIPVNSLMPIKGTPLEDRPRLTEDDILRTIAIFRFINPEADIRLAGGRALMADNGRCTFSSGASASITGNMLTTSGSTIKQDKEMLAELGRDTTPDWERPEEDRWDYKYKYREEAV